MKSRLRSLYLPKPKGSIYTHQFAEYLAEQFKTETISPEEFLLEVELTFKALERGTTASGECITHHAADRVPAAEPFIRMDMPDIIDAIFPADFAAEVKKTWKEVLEEMQANTSRQR